MASCACCVRGKQKSVKSKSQQKEEPNKMSGEQFFKDMLKSHNAYRSHHQAPPLVYDEKLAKEAGKWAEIIAKKDKLQHDDNNKGAFGENVAMKFNSDSTDFPGHEFTDYWYAEVENYDFNKENQIECGHFTQVVWKGTEKCGFGRAVSASGKVYVVGRYTPPGNFTDEFRKNVLLPKDGKVVIPKVQTQNGPSAGKKPNIGPNDPKDIHVGTKVSTTTKGRQKTEVIVETYQKPNGEKYTKTKEVTTTE